MPRSVAPVVKGVCAVLSDAVTEDEPAAEGLFRLCAALAAPTLPNMAAMDTSAALPARCIAGSLGFAGASCSTDPGGLHCAA